MELFGENGTATFWVEEGAYPGVSRIAEKVAEDIRMVSGKKPEILSGWKGRKKAAVLFATVGKSPLLMQLAAEEKISLAGVEGKREVYGICLLSVPFEMVEELLVIYGSDKRGTIYGMFHLSELAGVSPLVFWGDAVVEKREQMELDEKVTYLSKEPSVRYRGFFINDEWPCFGNWTFRHYGGFTAEMYDKVFELLLRLKGNYLWPAMWTSSFALDGPGEESAELADLYGVIMGNSHHEPCLRASEEWDLCRGTDSIYGNDWNYRKNKAGLLAYWRDGLRRSGGYESIITVGMRGERDSVMEGTITLQENIDILKDIITEQKVLIAEAEKETGKRHPMLLALYKEVERYFYGDSDTTTGLREWEGLSDIILMLCEDNFGHMRSLPDEKMRGHKGGYGMYYHLDYHGAPVSYEWINSTPLSLIWEQMSLAYVYGVREVWMVNVGDLKGNEFPLSYFMALAYDFDCWGNSNPASPAEFTEKWVRQQFGHKLKQGLVERMATLMTEGTALFARHRPEALCSNTYHPYHYCEADRVLAETDRLLGETKALSLELPQESRSAYESMFYYYLLAGCNLIQMQCYAGKNEHYARCGKKSANRYADLVRECIQKDKELIAEFGAWNQGKWEGMASGSHIGFTKWNEDGSRYPLRMYVEPFSKPRLVVSRRDGEKLLQKNYGTPDCMEICDFCDAGVTCVEIEVANTGNGRFCCDVSMEECPWLSFEMEKREVEEQELLILRCNRHFLPEKEECCRVRISDGNAVVKLLVYGKQVESHVPKMTFFARNGVISIGAEHFAKTILGEDGACPKRIFDYGLSGSGLKAMGAHSYFLGKGPGVVYYVQVKKDGKYFLELFSAPNNPVQPKQGIPFAVKAGAEECWRQIDSLPADYEAGEPDNQPWARGVLAQIHKTKVTVSLHKGFNEICIGFLDDVYVLEKLLLYDEEHIPRESCMGPPESWYQGK